MIPKLSTLPAPLGISTSFRHNILASALVLLGALACDSKRPAEREMATRSAEKVATGEAPQLGAKGRQVSQREDAAAQRTEENSLSLPKKPSCPSRMQLISGGQFWVGTKRAVFDHEENPRFQTRLATFCADTLEVSTEDYESCVSEGSCTEPELENITCNSSKKGRGDHPINCINHQQAAAVCALRHARLPTEVEWEYMARGGTEMRTYPWGDAAPDGNTCWKHGGTCKGGAFGVGAFGLYDVVGNVWEWTDSWFGRYPWPKKTGRHKVFRGGSWSRRFQKWMRPTLRNRVDPKDSGSHLGVRCVVTLKNAACPFGRSEDGECHAGVDAVECLDGRIWNGIRCARSGDDRRCPSKATEEVGFGCVEDTMKSLGSQELDLTGVTRTRSPEFDADCLAHTLGRPKAYRFIGGGHLARNIVGGKMGCKNRDVGVGFNSSCCP